MKLNEMYSEYLRGEGYIPNVDKDGDVVFKFEGRTYLLICDDEDPVYFQLVFPAFWSIESPEERSRALVAATNATRTTKVAKVYLTKNQDDVWASIEIFLKASEEFRDIFRRSMGALQKSVKTFVEEMRASQS